MLSLLKRSPPPIYPGSYFAFVVNTEYGKTPFFSLYEKLNGDGPEVTLKRRHLNILNIQRYSAHFSSIFGKSLVLGNNRVKNYGNFVSFYKILAE